LSQPITPVCHAVKKHILEAVATSDYVHRFISTGSSSSSSSKLVTVIITFKTKMKTT